MPRLSISLGDFEKCMSPRAIDSVGKYIERNLFLEVQFCERNLTGHKWVNGIECSDEKFVKTYLIQFSIMVNYALFPSIWRNL